jgi:signal peptidase I
METMTHDFSFWLMALTALFGVVWVIDALLFKRARLAKHSAGPAPESMAGEAGAVLPATPALRDPLLVEYARSFFPVLLMVLLVRSFIFEPFRIPSDSMMPTLLAGDFIFVSKFSYGLRIPVFSIKLLETGDPQRGDVVVFKLPSEPSINYIKRLIGLPGDHVVVLNDQVFVNGQPLKVQLGGLYNEHGYSDGQLGEESIDAIKHQVMYLPGAFPKDFDAIVPAGHYYFMGDNRDNSQDSRFPQVGFVPEKNLVGRAKMVWFHWKFTELPDLKRIGTHIH